MTLEEAKKKIKAQAEAEWEEFKKSGSMLCQGFALGADDALETLDKVEPVGNPEKLFEFDYVTVDANESITFWVRKPLYISMCGLWERNAYLDSWDIFNIDFSSAVNLDLSEYINENGEIDYSKCIVEVADDIE